MLGNVALERKALERTYDGSMTVTGTRKMLDEGETVLLPDAAIVENAPCALSFSGTPDSTNDGDKSSTRYCATICCAPELDIPAGSRITVRQYGVTYRFKYSGERIVYPTHQQISVVREGCA